MGATLIARLEPSSSGVDGFQLLANRLARDHQAIPVERWASVIRTYRQPIPPISPHHHHHHSREPGVSSTNKPARQRTLYSLRHSAWPGQLVAMIEDGSAPSRAAAASKSSTILNHPAPSPSGLAAQHNPIDGRLTPPDKTPPLAISPAQESPPPPDPQPVPTPVALASEIDPDEQPPSQADHQATLADKMLSPQPVTDSLDPSSLIILDPPPPIREQSASPNDPLNLASPTINQPSPTHFRITLLTVPDSFEFLLSSTLCSTTPATQVPSSWSSRSNMILVQGTVWAIYDRHSQDPTSSLTQPPGRSEATLASTAGPAVAGSTINSSGSKTNQQQQNIVGKKLKPDWWIRIGSVSNKGATGANASLPWLMVELECGASPTSLDPNSTFLESVLIGLVGADEDKLILKPFRPTQEGLMEAGLMNPIKSDSDSDEKTESRRNGYCLLMLAKQEGLI